MTDDHVDQEVRKRLRHALHSARATRDVRVNPTDLQSLLSALETAETERDEALNQLDSARHSVGVLERRCGEFRDQAETAEKRLMLAIPFVECHVKELERRFEETDDGGAYHDWQDARAIFAQIKEETEDGN